MFLFESQQISKHSLTLDFNFFLIIPLPLTFMVLSCQSSDFRGLVSCTLGAIKPLRRLGTGGRDTVVVTSFPCFGEWLRLSPIILLLLCCLVSAVGKVPKTPLLFSLRMEESTPNRGCPMYYPESAVAN